MSAPDTRRTPAAPNDHRAAPLGHSTAAHYAFGWCSHCPDHGTAEEVGAWRIREQERHEIEQAAALAAAASTDPLLDLATVRDRPCPVCGTDALTVVTVTLVEGRVRRRGGGWAYCTACDYTPPACYCQPGPTPHLAVPVPTTEETAGV